jgi:hypothetical protein
MSIRAGEFCGSDMETTLPLSLSEPFAAALKARRESLNARFAERRKAGGPIDAPAFLEHLAAVVDPIVQAVDREFPERTRAAVEQLYDLSLELFTLSLLGPRARLPQVDAVWRRLLPSFGRFLARDPARVAGCLSNAAWNLVQQAGTRPDWWIGAMGDLAADCKGIDDVLGCGIVLAWQAGMAQYRTGALEQARKLPPTLAARALHLPGDASLARVASALDRLSHDPWLTTGSAAENDGDVKSTVCVRTLGGFRGFGGAFLRPPKVSGSDGCLWVGDGEFFWELRADVYGWHLHRTGAGSVPANQARDGIAIDRKGTVSWQGACAAFPDLAGASSIGCDGTTVAVTVPTSHHVFLLARR